MKVYAHKGYLHWLKNRQDEARTGCITVYSFKEFEDDEELDLQISKEVSK